MSTETDLALHRIRTALLAQERAIQQIARANGSRLTVQSVGPLVRLFKEAQSLLPDQVQPFDFHADPNSALPQIAHALFAVNEALGASASDPEREREYSTGPSTRTDSAPNHMVFIGHGHSALWRELKDFVADSLKLPWDEFNREAAAGYFTHERLTDMLNRAGFALLVYTGEDELADGSIRTRENVVYETGLFQGRLGFRRSLILREDGCSMLSNLDGLTRLDFPKGNIRAVFEDVRAVLRREGFSANS
jgi:predicted nucleotide-binding protein